MGRHALLLAALYLLQVTGNNAFNFANSLGSSMVLQRSPKQATVWGSAVAENHAGFNITIQIIEGENTTVATAYGSVSDVEIPDQEGYVAWKVLLPAMQAGGPYKVVASLDGDTDESTIAMTDVMFGDVWLCSGQSNMDMQIYKVFNGTDEIYMAPNYTDIRLFAVGRSEATSPQSDLTAIKQEWSRPDEAIVAEYSAVCWKFGRKMYDMYKVPVGLIQSTWGGTFVESWSSVEALRECYGDEGVFNKNDPSVLWNAMIHPLLKTTIVGAIWYQGETNARSIAFTAGYECTFPAMIKDWRRQFLATSEQTDPEFSFGFVQLAGTGQTSTGAVGFPHLRWKQTANRGFVPNEQMPNTFMSVAHDLPDQDSPWGANHPRDKETVAQRLFLSARAQHLGEEKVVHAGPMPVAYRFNPTSYTLELQYEKSKQIEVRSAEGFEICCSDNTDTPCTPTDDRWTSVSMIKSDKGVLTLSTSNCLSEHVMGHRYAWSVYPCQYKMCAVYAAKSDIPAPVYVSLGRLKDDTVWHNIKF